MTLVETAIAVGLAAIFIAVSVTVVIQAQATANSAKLKNQSTIYAEQLKEKIISFKKKNSWVALYPTTSPAFYKDINIQNGTLDAGSPAITSCTAPAAADIDTNVFSQCFAINTTSSTRLIQVDVSVFYKDRGSVKTTKLSFYLSDT